jgi:sugar lactone lactonase YvrE
MSATIRRVSPPAVVAGGTIVIEGDDFVVAPGQRPLVTVGGHDALLLRASASALAVRLPDGLPGGTLPIAVEGVDGATAFIAAGATLATGVHLVDSPAYDPQGRLYATLSGSRGQETPVSVYRIDRDGGREAFVTGVANATSLAIGPDGALYVSSRFDGAVFRVSPDGEPELFCNELGVACGLAFDTEGRLYVGDRSGSVHRVTPDGRAEVFATLPPSIAAYHLAMAPDDVLHVAVPTLNSSDAVYRIERDGSVTRWVERFGRPQGLAFDQQGRLHVVDALAGDSGVFRLTPDGDRDLIVSGQDLIGIAFDPTGGFAVGTAEVVYRFEG